MQIVEYQALMEGLFPERAHYDANTMHPVVIGGNDGTIPKVYFLIMADDYLFDPIVSSPTDEVQVAINVLGVANENGINKDLRFRTEFIYPETQPSFVSVVSGKNQELQRLLQALAQVQDITFFVADMSMSLLSVVRIPWNYYKFETDFMDIIEANEKAKQLQLTR